jgi:hypothetical protein
MFDPRPAEVLGLSQSDPDFLGSHAPGREQRDFCHQRLIEAGADLYVAETKRLNLQGQWQNHQGQYQGNFPRHHSLPIRIRSGCLIVAQWQSAASRPTVCPRVAEDVGQERSTPQSHDFYQLRTIQSCACITLWLRNARLWRVFATIPTLLHHFPVVAQPDVY